jgi:hypothetical protein
VTDTDATLTLDYQSQLRTAIEVETGTRLRAKVLRRTGHPIYRYDSDGGINWPHTPIDLGDGELPLYTPSVTPVDSCLVPSPWLTSQTLYTNVMALAASEGGTTSTEDGPPPSTFTDDEVDDMLAGGLLRPRRNGSDPADMPRAWCRAWGRPELAKRRRRLIVHPYQVNEAVKAIGVDRSVRFPSREDIIAFASSAGGSWSPDFVEADITACFWHYALQLVVQTYFAIRIRTATRDFTAFFTRLPMGFVMSALIAQRNTEALARLALQRAALRLQSPISAFFLVQIDNIFIRPRGPDAHLVRSCLQESAAESGIALKFCLTASSGTILGFELSWSPDRRVMISVPLALRARLSSALDDLGDADSAGLTVPLQRALEIFGVASRHIFVLGAAWSKFYFILKDISRAGIYMGNLPRPSLRDRRHFTISTSAWRQLRELRLLGEFHAPTPAPWTHAELFIVTDASPTGLGAVYWKPGTAPVVQGSPLLEPCEDQGDREAQAVRWGLETVAAAVGSHHKLALIIDNQGLFFALRKRRSTHWPFNLTVSCALRLFPDFQVFWVPSEANVADAPSRALQR